MPQTHLFEMRRLEMLSNTIFGVAMTLLAYDLPKASSFATAPRWIDLLRVYAQPVIALAISFVVAGMFWFSHHRRLAVAPEAGRSVVFLNLLFLLSIVILPVVLLGFVQPGENAHAPDEWMSLANYEGAIRAVIRTFDEIAAIPR